jgi:hypothetical protein
MSDRMEIKDEQLDNINGGAITYTWNGTTGSLGVDGNNVFTLHNKDAFLEVYNSMFGKYSDVEIIKELKARKIITK